jgi:hypothetical protein
MKYGNKPATRTCRNVNAATAEILEMFKRCLSSSCWRTAKVNRAEIRKLQNRLVEESLQFTNPVINGVPSFAVSVRLSRGTATPEPNSKFTILPSFLPSFFPSFLLSFLPTFTQYEGRKERRKEGKKEGRKERRKEAIFLILDRLLRMSKIMFSKQIINVLRNNHSSKGNKSLSYQLYNIYVYLLFFIIWKTMEIHREI